MAESISFLVVQEATNEKKEDKFGNNDSAFIVNKKQRICYYCNNKRHFKHECYDNPQNAKYRGNQKQIWNNNFSNNSYRGNNNHLEGKIMFSIGKIITNTEISFSTKITIDMEIIIISKIIKIPISILETRKIKIRIFHLSLILLSTKKSNNDSKNLKNKWFIDLGTTVHMCNNSNYFSKINRDHKRDSFSVGDGEKATVEEIGNVICSLKITETLIRSNSMMFFLFQR